MSKTNIDCKHELKSKLSTGFQTAAVYELLRKDVKEHGLKKEGKISVVW